MSQLPRETVEYALTRLTQLMESRDLNQVKLAQLSSISQSKISRLFSKSLVPTPEDLTKLAEGMGVRYSDILPDPDDTHEELIGYLATPLTSVASFPAKDAELTRIVRIIQNIAASPTFANPSFRIYWPGDYTHPVRHPEFKSRKVYLLDRSRASSYDFVILFCAEPSFGVGQENEIITQAGISSIRFVPSQLSRMMTGSFVKAIDIEFSGSLSSTISFQEESLRRALSDIRVIHFANRSRFAGINGREFPARLKELIGTRSRGLQEFADNLGVDVSYVKALTEEPVTVSNPSVQLIKRMSVLLGEPVSYIVGESPRVEKAWEESKAAWFEWVSENESLNGETAVKVFQEWKHNYNLERGNVMPGGSSRQILSSVSLSKVDWDERYQKKMREAKRDGGKGGLFRR